MSNQDKKVDWGKIERLFMEICDELDIDLGEAMYVTISMSDGFKDEFGNLVPIIEVDVAVHIPHLKYQNASASFSLSPSGNEGII